MAAKRKGGLKLNAICAKLSRQVVFDHGGAEQARADKGPQRESSNKDLPQPGTKEPGTEFSDGLSRVQKIEEDKRREVIEKWVNGEYNEEPLLGRAEGKECKGVESVEVPPEGVYMVQPKGCSDEEDNGDEADALRGSQDGAFLDDRDSDGTASKDDAYRASGGEAASKLGAGTASGKPPATHPCTGQLLGCAFRGRGRAAGYLLAVGEGWRLPNPPAEACLPAASSLLGPCPVCSVPFLSRVCAGRTGLGDSPQTVDPVAG